MKICALMTDGHLFIILTPARFKGKKHERRLDWISPIIKLRSRIFFIDGDTVAVFG